MQQITTNTGTASGQVVVTPGQPQQNEAADKELALTAQLTARMNKIAEAARSVEHVLKGCLALQKERDNVLGCVMLRQDGNDGLAIAMHALTTDDESLNDMHEWLLPKVAEAMKRELPIIAKSTNKAIELVVVPTQCLDMCAMVTILRSPLSTKQQSLELGVAQLFAAFLWGASNRDRILELTSQLNVTAATLELVQRIQHAPTVDAACLQVVADLKNHLKCDQVFLGLNSGGKTCHVRAASDVASLDPNAESTIAMKAVLDECVGRDESGSWPPLPGISPHQLLAHKKLARRDLLVISTPLKTIDGELVGALAIMGRREMASVPNLKNFVASIAEPLATTLRTIVQNQGGPIRRALKIVSAAKHRAIRIAIGAILLLVALIMLLPWTYTIRCRGVIEPMERRFCVAPHEGLLQSTLAEPGDVVQSGQLLARMDGREILWELAGVSADRSRAAKQRDSHMAKQETAEALMAELEMKRLENHERLLQFRESNLEMVSPIEGIVLSGSLDRRENYPVNKGQVLYEIAPLDRLRIEVNIPADEVIHVDAGDKARILFDGFGTEVIEGSIEKIRPRAEIREQENVFVAEINIDNHDRQLRPGMKGLAKVATERRMVGWILFHHAWEHFRAAMPF